MISADIDCHLRKWRADLHAIPELSFVEFKTQAYIEARLDEMGLVPRRMAGTGLVVDFRSFIAGPCIAFRADMDALPFAQHPDGGVGGDRTLVAKHACGHDMHTAMLLGLAKLLHERQVLHRGTVRLIFQPAEEVLTSRSGASMLLEEGVLEDPHVERIYALHVSPRFKVGTIAYADGLLMAESARLGIEVAGRGGHGASTTAHDDVLLAAAELLSCLDASRSNRPSGTAFSFCQIHGGSAANVRPGLIQIEGTARAHIEGGALGCAEFLREQTVRFSSRYPALTFAVHSAAAYPLLKNCRTAVAKLLEAARALKHVQVVQIEPSWASEDFAIFLQQRCGGMFLLGVNDGSSGSEAAVHCEDFRGSDAALSVGTQCMAEIVRRELGCDA